MPKLIYAYVVMDGFVKDGDGYDYHIHIQSRYGLSF
jgi:hypothetical protein